MRWAFGESYGLLPDTDPQLEPAKMYFLACPVGLDVFEPFLPDIVCRPFERRSAQWPAADETMKARVAQSRKELPSAPEREVLHLLAENGKVLGYSGYTPERNGRLWPWIERRAQVWRDVRAGYRYFVVHDGTEIDLECGQHQQVVAKGSDGHDLLAALPAPGHSALDADRLVMNEKYPDLYLQMRLWSDDSSATY